MFLVIILYAIIGGMSLLGAISLMRGGPQFILMNIIYAIAQIILIITLLIRGSYDAGILECISLILGILGIVNLILGYCRIRRVNMLMGVSQIILFCILI